MNGGVLPFVLLCLTVGLALSRVERRTAWIAAVCLAASALLTSLAPVPASLTEMLFVGLWLSIIATAVVTYLPRAMAQRLAVPAAINAGIWAGLLAAVSTMHAGLAAALLLCLIFVLGQWFASRGYDLPMKVAASWMIAIASLSMFVSFVQTPGYKPDHMQ